MRGFGLFETFFQIAKGLEAVAFVFVNPALADLVQRHGIEIMQFLASVPDGSDEVGGFEQAQVLGDGLARHVEMTAKRAERLAVVLAQCIEQLAPAGVRQGFKYCIHR